MTYLFTYMYKMLGKYDVQPVWLVEVLPYMGVAAILVMWPRPREETFVAPSHRGSIWNLALIGPAVWRRRSLKMVAGQRTDNGRTDDGSWLYYKLTNEPKGSGELKCTKIVIFDVALWKIGQSTVGPGSSFSNSL